MRRLLLTAIALLLGCNASPAQVSTMGTTAMGLSSTPGTMLSSPLNGPSPFSVATMPGVPATTLAPLPLTSNPATPGTFVTCATPSGQIAPATPTVTLASTSVTGGTTGTIPSASAPLPPGIPAQPPPSITAAPVPALSTVPNTAPTSIMGSTATTIPSTTTMSSTALTPGVPLGTIVVPNLGSTTGTIAPTSLLGSSSTTVCSTTPGGPPTNGAALPLSTPQIPANPPLGTIQPDITELGGTSIDPTMTVVPTPNTSACAEGMTMNVATPGMMAPANATGAAATPGVSAPLSPSGC